MDEACPLTTSKPICIQSKMLDADVKLHIQNQLASDNKLKNWPPELKFEIERYLIEHVNGMCEKFPLFFLLVITWLILLYKVSMGFVSALMP